MDITLTTPALLFPALSLLLLAYTNRFLGLSTVIRNLYADYQKSPDPNLLGQIDNLRYRVILIRNMQIAGAASILGCVVCMLVLFFGLIELGKCDLHRQPDPAGPLAGPVHPRAADLGRCAGIAPRRPGGRRAPDARLTVTRPEHRPLHWHCLCGTALT